MSVQGAELAKAHRFPIPAPTALIESRDASILVRYDGVTTKTQPAPGAEAKAHQIIWFVIPGGDLAKLPESVLEGLDLAARRPDGSFTTSKNAFFVSSAAGVSLYVDSDIHEGFLENLASAAEDAGLKVFNARGDIVKNMLGQNGDIDPPLVPAYVANGHSRVPTLESLAIIREMRDARQQNDIQKPSGKAEYAQPRPLRDIWGEGATSTADGPKPY